MTKAEKILAVMGALLTICGSVAGSAYAVGRVTATTESQLAQHDRQIDELYGKTAATDGRQQATERWQSGIDAKLEDLRQSAIRIEKKLDDRH